MTENYQTHETHHPLETRADDSWHQRKKNKKASYQTFSFYDLIRKREFLHFCYGTNNTDARSKTIAYAFSLPELQKQFYLSGTALPHII